MIELAKRVWAAVYPERKPWEEIGEEAKKEWNRFTIETIKIWETLSLTEKAKYYAGLGLDN